MDLKRRRRILGTNVDNSIDMAQNNVVDNPDLSEADVEKLKQFEEGTMRAELKHIDKKFTEKGQAYYAETVTEEIPEQVNWWGNFALCLVRHLDRNMKDRVINTTLQVNSQHLKDILKRTILFYPGISFATKEITIQQPYHPLFHYRREIAAAGKDLETGSEAAEHLALLVGFINEHFKDIIEETDNLLSEGRVTYPNLWTVFRPGSTIYAPVFGQPRAFTLNSYNYSCNPAGLFLHIEFVDFDGEDMGTRMTQRLVPAFTGSMKIDELSAYPIDRHPQKAELKRQLISRGRRWEQHCAMDFHEYKGIAVQYDACGAVSRYNIDGRVVVDTKTYHRLNADCAFTVNAFKSSEEKRAKRRRIDNEEGDDSLDLIPETQIEIDALTDEQRLLANSTLRGFFFGEKLWLDFFIDKLSPVHWNKNCFDELVLPAEQKNLIKALVATHVQERLAFDDIVKGKGKGLILVLHGSPGVGKTLTAETVAEYCRRPLYMVSSGDLGTESSTLDQRLSRILDMASTWKAILLIDEADIFLERRSLHDMQRNSLVSIFLRVLEYYQGILFLTSNRVDTFDDAFKSRIHVPLKYNELTHESRKKIWKNFLRRADAEIDEKGYSALAEAQINGRQIKNVIRTAKSLAQFHGDKLERGMLEQVIGIQMEFERELATMGDGELVNGVNGHMVNGH